MLANETCIGHSVHNKQTSASFKSKQKVRKPKDEWYRVENTHEAIIAEEDFYRVREMIDILRRNGERMAEMFRTRWIPMGEACFEAFNILQQADFID